VETTGDKTDFNIMSYNFKVTGNDDIFIRNNNQICTINHVQIYISLKMTN